MEKLYVIKIGGNILDDETALYHFLQSFAEIKEHTILVHGGGKLATRVAESMGISQQMKEGRRITDEATLDVVTMVYAGAVNKKVVASLQSLGCHAFGVTGTDGNIIRTHKRINKEIDYGFVGDVDQVNTTLVQGLISLGLSLVVAPITHDGNGQLLNTNADTVAQSMAVGLAGMYDVSLVYCFEKNGVLSEASNDASVIKSVTPAYYQELKDAGVVTAGMIPKLDNAFLAINAGVRQVIIGHGRDLPLLLINEAGTAITNG